MPTPIDVDVLTDPDIQKFAEAARQFCELVERIDALPKSYFLQQVDELLPLVYSLAHRVRDPYYWPEDDKDDEGVDVPEFLKTNAQIDQRVQLDREWTQRIGRKLGEHDLFRLIWDPMSRDNPEAIDGTLSNSIAGVYLDLKEGLVLYQTDAIEAKAQALWDWRFGLNYHWGGHATEIMLAIHRLMHNHYDEDEGRFDI